MAKFQFKVTNGWIHCGHNRTTINEFYEVGKEDTIRTELFVLDADETQSMATLRRVED